MSNSQKTVLLFQPSEFQAVIWRFVLWEYKIFVVWKENCINKNQINNYFKTLQFTPTLLIIDSKIDNIYEHCHYFHQSYPLSKIILTTDYKSGSLLTIRRWATNQGINELLINFQKSNLFPSIHSNINCVLKLLEYSPAKQENIIKVLEFLEKQNIIKLPKKASRFRIADVSYQNTETIDTRNTKTTKNKTVSPIIHLSFILGTLLIITVALDVSILYLITPIQRLQHKILAHSREQRTSNNTRVNNTPEKNEVEIPHGIFNYGGSTTWAPIRKIVNPQINQEHPEFNLRYVVAIDSTPGSGTGIRMLLEGQLDFAQSSRPIKQKEHVLAHKQGFTLRNYHVAIDAIAIAVNPSLQISGLTIEQLKQIYLGQIVNWKEVNGPDLQIIPLSRQPKDGGTPEFFQHHVLHNQSFGNNVKYVYSTTDGLRQVIQTPGAIYYASAPEIIPQCAVKSLSLANKDQEFIPPYLPPVVPPENCPQQRNRLNIAAIRNATYPLTRYLSVIVKQDDDRSQQAGEAYTRLMLTKKMQQSIEQAGFVPIK